MMRHADSNESGSGRDIDRSITEAGRQAAHQVPRLLIIAMLRNNTVGLAKPRAEKWSFLDTSLGVMKYFIQIVRGELYLPPHLEGATSSLLYGP